MLQALFDNGCLERVHEEKLLGLNLVNHHGICLLHELYQPTKIIKLLYSHQEMLIKRDKRVEHTVDTVIFLGEI